MIRTLTEQVVSSFELTDVQREAALERGRDVVVTAGAGSGKTRTLVARYASLLSEGFEPRRVIAITFTEKAAREMRSRVREAISKLIQAAQDGDERQLWLALSTRMDSARIGTIHGLCAEILRAHPAEAGIDPRFDVLDEGLTAALRAQVVEDTLSEFVENPAFTPLFTILEIDELGSLMQFLIEHRLEVEELFTEKLDSNVVVSKYFESTLRRHELADAISDLRSLSPADLAADKLDGLVPELLSNWKCAEDALARGDICECARILYQTRRQNMKLNVGKRVCRTKDILSDLQKAYDEFLDPILGGKNSGTQPDQETEQNFAILAPLLVEAFEQLSCNYRAALDQRRALDFDDLEAGAASLLARDDIRYRWQGELDALLVDEFQDTNQRQRKIVEALAGSQGRLFVVGDARQSIYRFRRADVTVFRAIQQKVESAGGLVLELDLTYRAHEPLLQATGDLLADIMGIQEDPFRTYYVPFSQLDAHRKEAPEHFHSPHIEIVLGAGEETSDARPIMAKALAQRLLELKSEKQIRTWDDVALLFRASSGYTYYENVFEELGIPFVTVAGRGFYDRPEIRDLLNLLRALADPSDDLAMAGLLRSPAFGLTDAALYLLRTRGDATVSYWQSLQEDFSYLDTADQERAKRTVEILNQLLTQVDRIPVAELLKHLVDITDYRAILASEGENVTGGRLWRNVDKLLADAHASGRVNVRDFLDYLTTLSEAGAREGEAPADAQGAVRLMTIHKSKGLEFPIVVLADAGRERRAVSEQAYLLSETGLAVKLDPPPMLYRLAKWQDGLQNEAEALRILYVALTRAQEKLIISGHTTPTSKRQWKSAEWMGEIAGCTQIDLNALVEQAGMPSISHTAAGHPVRAIAYTTMDDSEHIPLDIVNPAEDPSNALPLFHPLVDFQFLGNLRDESNNVRAWRATGYKAHVPPSVVGQLIHKAIELWLFPDDPGFMDLLETFALDFGLATIEQRIAAVQRARELLERLQAHPFWIELRGATQRHHEVPYSYLVENHAETGYIDLMCRTTAGWQLIDFKTDSIRSAAERDYLTEKYLRQMIKYRSAVEALMGESPSIYVCFLDDCESVNVISWM